MGEEMSFPRYEMLIDIGKRRHSEKLPLEQAAEAIIYDHVNVDFGTEVEVFPGVTRPLDENDKNEIYGSAPRWAE